jgi:hypothetical protein
MLVDEDNSPLCDAIRDQGTSACPDESSGNYRSRSTPATPACPARGSGGDQFLACELGKTMPEGLPRSRGCTPIKSVERFGLLALSIPMEALPVP